MPVISRGTTPRYDIRAFAPFHYYRKITIGTTDVSNDATSFTITHGSTNRVGSFDLLLNNSDGKYVDTNLKYAEIKFYVDTTGVLDNDSLIFAGRIDTPVFTLGNDGMLLNLTGRDYMIEADVLVFEDFSTTPTSASELLKYLRNKYAPTHSTSDAYIDVIDTLVKPSWNGKPLLNCIEDIVTDIQGTHTFRCDVNRVWHFRQKGTISSGFAITFRGNMTYLRNTDGSILDLVNRTYLAGQHPAGVPILYRADNNSSQTLYGTHEKISEDSNLVTQGQVIARAIAMNSISSSMEQKGSVGSWGLPKLFPGQDVMLICPYSKVNGTKTAVDVTLSWSSGGCLTDIAYEQLEQGLIDNLIVTGKLAKDLFRTQNLYGMTRTFNMEFLDINYGATAYTPDADAALEEMNDTIVWDDALQLQLLESTGYAITRLHEADGNVTQAILNLAGSNFESDLNETWLKVEASFDGGGTWSTIIPTVLFTVPTDNIGSRIKLKFTFTSLTTKMTAVSLLYKLEGQ